jgi:hypothetical protein
MTDQERQIHNEQIKLLATFFNNSGVAYIAGGAFALVWQGALSGVTDVSKFVTELAAMGFGFLLHYFGSSA